MLLTDRITSLPEFLARGNPTPLMDLRTIDESATQRLNSPKIPLVRFPIEFLKARSFELPARHVEFALLLHGSDLKQAEAFLLGSNDNTRKRAQKPWLVTAVLLDTPELWKEAKVLNICHEPTSKTITSEFPLPRLWQPDKMIQEVFLPLLRDSLTSHDEVWDLASGAGRDVAFLAEELVSSKTDFHKVFGFDHRYNKKETEIVSGFWDRRGVTDKTSAVKMDLSNFITLEEQILESSENHHHSKNVAALFAVRFWKVALIEALANSESLITGTLFGISHFCKPFDGATWEFEHPSEKTVLKRKQLKDLFQKDNKWEIIHDEITLDSDHGRSMIHFVARKR
jgi:hypothetical protein